MTDVIIPPAGIADAGVQPESPATQAFHNLWTLLEAKLNEKGTREAAVDQVIKIIDAAEPALVPILAKLEPVLKALADIGAK